MHVQEAGWGDGGSLGSAMHLEWYRRLADVFRDVLSEQSLSALLHRIADTVAELVPYDALTIYEADTEQRTLVPMLARDQWENQVMGAHCKFGEGITGWAVEAREAVLANQAHRDPRVVSIAGTPNDPESMITIPLVSRDSVKGALNIYRVGENAHFTAEEFELAKRFADAAALALDNAKLLSILEQQALTDPLTGLYNHRHFQERLRSELERANRSKDSTALLMLDIDDFKRINDVYGHLTGDTVLVALADVLKETVRAADVPCRIGGEEFCVILPSCDAGDALGLATRLLNRVGELDFEDIGGISISLGISQGPEHAMNARELVAYAEAAMLTAKAKGGNRVILFDEELSDTPGVAVPGSKRDVRSVAHLKMLQSLASKLNKLNDVTAISTTITRELRTLIDYHSCRVYIVEEDGTMQPVTARGDLMEYPRVHGQYAELKVGEGIPGRAALTGRSINIPNSLECDFALIMPGAEDIEESVLVTPLIYGTTVIGVIAITKLGVGQFSDADVQLLEVLAGHASVAIENARLYERERREAQHAKALLEFADLVSKAPSFESIGEETAKTAAKLLEAGQSSLWLQEPRTGRFVCAAHYGMEGDPEGEAIIAEAIETIDAENFLWGHEAPWIVSPELQEQFFQTPGAVRTRYIAAAPLRTGHGVRGWISVRSPHPTDVFFRNDHLKLLEGLSYQASVAMQKTSLYKAQKEEAEVANALLQFSRELASAEGLDEVLDRVVQQAARILSSPNTSVWMQDNGTGELRTEACWGYVGGDKETIEVARISQEAAYRFLAGSEPFVATHRELTYIDAVGTISEDTPFAVGPLQLDGRLGCIVAVAPTVEEYEFGDKKMRLLAGICDQAKLAIANASSFENLERTFYETVEALANALEAQDEYTASHARSLTDMVLEVGAEMGIEGKDLKRLELGALFHDIGKIGIPSDILRKPGPLTDEEWKIIKMHPELGEKILAPIDRLADVRPIVRHCHEHYDGSGYPDKLRANEIPIESRIILVCDAFDAMTTDRSYRKALPVVEACRRLNEASGGQFDPEIVEAFMRCVDRFTEEHERNAIVEPIVDDNTIVAGGYGSV
ncbi:MAG TPA: diguanylate cyclase, partial [Actinomycetota bacterium]|nr:diguanylate cyclase [Actinomycetota bacterium]